MPGGYGVLESLDVRNGIARNTALPAALVKAVGETCRSAEAEQVGAVHRNGADPRRRYQPFEFDIEIERRRNAELVEPAQSERERLVRTRTVVLVALVGEVRGHISETGERHGIVGSVFTVTPCPVGEVEHEIGMHEQIGPFRLAQHIVEIGEPPPCNWRRIPVTGWNHLVRPKLASKLIRSPKLPWLVPLERAVPAPPPSVISQLSQKPFDTKPAKLGFLGVSCAHTDVANATAANNRISFFMVNNI